MSSLKTLSREHHLVLIVFTVDLVVNMLGQGIRLGQVPPKCQLCGQESNQIETGIETSGLGNGSGSEPSDDSCGHSDKYLELSECSLLGLRPLPQLVLLGQLAEGACHIGEVWDKPPVEIDKAHKGLDLGHTFWSQPCFDISNFDWVHLHTALRQDKTRPRYSTMRCLNEHFSAFR